MMMTTNILSLLLLLQPFGSLVVAVDTTIEWTIEDVAALPQQTAKPGDTFTFNFITGLHNVYIHPSGTCDTEGSIEVGFLIGTTYTFTEEEAGTEVTFACQVGSHCEAGQIMTVVVEGGNGPADTPTVAPVSSIPSATSMPSLSGVPSSSGAPSGEISVLPSAEAIDDGSDGDDTNSTNSTGGADGLEDGESSSAMAYGLSASCFTLTSVLVVAIGTLLG